MSFFFQKKETLYTKWFVHGERATELTFDFFFWQLLGYDREADGNLRNQMGTFFLLFTAHYLVFLFLSFPQREKTITLGQNAIEVAQFFSFIYLSFFSQLATAVGKSALDVASAAMTAQDKITAAAMAAPAKIYRFKRKKKREKKEKEITEKDPRCHGCARQHLKRRGKNEKLKKLLHPPLIFGTKPELNRKLYSKLDSKP